MSKFDLAVIGAGPGGYVAAIRAAQLGMKTVCIDKAKSLGGTCLNIGCIPSKCLLQSSEAYAWLQNSSREHGIAVSGLSIDFAQMMQRKDKVVKSLTDGVANLFRHHDIERVEGRAHFESPHLLTVTQDQESRQIEAESIILATGSEPVPLPFLPFDERVVLSSRGALALPQIPKTMLIIGAGVIGVELASVYQRLGSQVTLIEMLDHICPGMDGAIGKTLLSVLKKQGLTFYLGAKVLRAQIEPAGVTLAVNVDQKEQSFTADVVLVAVGRRPYTESLKLSEIGIQTTSKGFVPVDSNFRTVQPHIYAIGDLIEGQMLAHRASDEGVAVVELIKGMKPHLNYLAIPNVIYTHPEVAAVGMTEKEALEAGLELIVGTSWMRGNPRARCAGELDGIVKVIGEKKSGRLVGLHIMAAHASEMIGEGVMALEKEATVEEIARASHAHPTLSEAIKEAAGSAIGHAIHQ